MSSRKYQHQYKLLSMTRLIVFLCVTTKNNKSLILLKSQGFCKSVNNSLFIISRTVTQEVNIEIKSIKCLFNSQIKKNLKYLQVTCTNNMASKATIYNVSFYKFLSVDFIECVYERAFIIYLSSLLVVSFNRNCLSLIVTRLS